MWASCSQSIISYQYANHFHQPTSTSWRLEVFVEFTVPSHGKNPDSPKGRGEIPKPTGKHHGQPSQVSHISYQMLHVSISYTLTTRIIWDLIAHLGWLKPRSCSGTPWLILKNRSLAMLLGIWLDLTAGQFLSLLSIGQAQKQCLVLMYGLHNFW